MSLLKFSVSGKSVNATKFVAKTRQFQIVIDEPPALGGADEAANPVEYLLASYAGCLNVVAHIVAQEQKIDLKGLKIAIEGEIDPARLFGHATDARAGYQGISVQLEADTDASAERLNLWLVEIEKRCPINDNLTGSTPISLSVGNQRLSHLAA
ncbi:MAG: OsmC family protein [Bacteroidia bacterium]